MREAVSEKGDRQTPGLAASKSSCRESAGPTRSSQHCPEPSSSRVVDKSDNAELWSAHLLGRAAKILGELLHRSNVASDRLRSPSGQPHSRHAVARSGQAS